MSIPTPNPLGAELELICSSTLRSIARDCLQLCPTCFWSMPASTSGTYHPASDLGEGGLIRHTRNVVAVARLLLNQYGINEGSADGDIILAAALLHDCCRKSDTEQHSAFDHPLRAAALWQNAAAPYLARDRHPAIVRMIRRTKNCIAAHMGRWNTSAREPRLILPLPDGVLETIVHTADYIASRKSITIATDHA